MVLLYHNYLGRVKNQILSTTDPVRNSSRVKRLALALVAELRSFQVPCAHRSNGSLLAIEW